MNEVIHMDEKNKSLCQINIWNFQVFVKLMLKQ